MNTLLVRHHRDLYILNAMENFMKIIMNATPLIYLTKIRLIEKIVEFYEVITTKEIFNEVTVEFEKYEDAMRLKEMEQKFLIDSVDHKEFSNLSLEIGDKSLLGLIRKNIDSIRKGDMLLIADDSELRKNIKSMLHSWKAKKRLYLTPEFVYKMYKDNLITKENLISYLKKMRDTTYMKKKVISNILEVLK